MLWKRSGAVLMADHHLASPAARTNRTASSSSLFATPRLLIRSFSGKTLDSDAAMSPTSILESKTFYSSKSSSKSFSASSDAESGRGIGLAIADALAEEKTRRVLIGSQLKIQIPSLAEFGIKTRGSLLKSAPSSSNLAADPPSPALINGWELSEDYTCVITRGPNPRTTHIFEDYIVESEGENLPAKEKDNGGFLSFCHACNKDLRHGEETFMYRGERAFCSEDCRSEGIKFCS